MVRFLDTCWWSDSWMHSYSQILFIDEDILGLITPVSKTLPCVSKYALWGSFYWWLESLMQQTFVENLALWVRAACPASTWLYFAHNAFQVLLCSTWNANTLSHGIPDSTMLHLEYSCWIAWLCFAHNAFQVPLCSTWNAKVLLLLHCARNASHLELRSSWDAKVVRQCMPSGALLQLACLT